MVDYILVDTEKADQAIRSLRKCNLLRTDSKIISRGSRVGIPVKEIPLEMKDKAFRSEIIPRHISRSPYEIVMDYATANGIPQEIVPDKWIRYGDSIVLNLTGEESTQRKIAESYAGSVGVSSVYRVDGKIKGIIREPTLTLVFGPGGPVMHLENGIKFVFDPSMIMFSPGNVNERVSMKGFNASGKRVLDMFAGIGYFSLPLAKYQNPSVIKCCEINPVSADYLRKSAVANKLLDKISIFIGDSRLLKSDSLYDIILMGNFSSTAFIVKALSLINNGGLIVLHHLVSKERLKTVHADMIRRISRFSYSAKLVDTHIVKSVGPNYYHVSTTFSIDRLQ